MNKTIFFIYVALSLCIKYEVEFILSVLYKLKLMKKNLKTKLICPFSRATFGVITTTRLVIAGHYLMETTSEFVASNFAMTNQRLLIHFLIIEIYVFWLASVLFDLLLHHWWYIFWRFLLVNISWNLLLLTGSKIQKEWTMLPDDVGVQHK